MQYRKIVFTALVSFTSAVAGVYVFDKYFNHDPKIVYSENPAKVTFASLSNARSGTQPVDFRYAAATVTPSVVHVKSMIKVEPVSMRGRDPFRDFFGDNFGNYFHGPNPYQGGARVGTGSGVIVSKDGYIVTNNHVVENANEISVTLNNNKTYSAKIVGRDADVDIALLKVDASDLPAVQFANSDSVLVGEWVVAVGNPFNLASTVTAGIVSAKGRNLDLLEGGSRQSNTKIESFIQTDAAVNPGNSGGALVNVNGELVGINTAIASPTGTYAGYSFAVPSNIVNKVILDLKNYGTTQRGFLGVSIRSMDDELAKKQGFDKPFGVYLNEVNAGSAAESAGLKKEDIVTKINGHEVNSAAELQEQIAQYRPGDKINVEYIRNSKTALAVVELKNKYNTVAKVDNATDVLDALGVTVENLTAREKASLGVESGVKITDLKNGKLAQFTDIRKGFIITQIDDQPVADVKDFTNILKNKSGKVLMEGIYPNRPINYLYAFRM